MGESACVVKPSRRVAVAVGSAFFVVVPPREGARHRVTLPLLETYHDVVAVGERAEVNEWPHGAGDAAAFLSGFTRDGTAY